MVTTPIRLCDANTPEWLEARRSGIGSSEAAAACGLSAYTTPLELYHRKRGELADDDTDDAARRLGHLLEPVVATEFANATGIGVRRLTLGLHQHPDHEWMLASPDADLEDDSLGEWKTTTWRIAKQLGPAGSDEVPTDWLFQALHQMAVMGRDLVHVAVLVDGRELRVFPIRRHEGLIGKMVRAERELWERIVNGDPPEPNWEHDTTPALVRELHNVVEGGTAVALDTDDEWRWREAKRLRRDATRLTTAAEVLEAQVLHRIGDAAAGVLPGGERMIRRKLVTRKGYYVEPSEYVKTIEAKYDPKLALLPDRKARLEHALAIEYAEGE